MKKENLTRVAPSQIDGLGVFARSEIGAGTFIGSYLGPRAKRDGKYVLWVCQEDKRPYGRRGTNKLRFLNHSGTPNGVFDGFELYALRGIKAGEEITIDYAGG